MIRLLIFLFSIVFIAGAVTFFALTGDRITGEAFGYKFDAHSGVIMGGLIFLFAAAIYLTHKIKDMLALPAKIRARDEAAHRARGVEALTRGLEAVAVGDASAAVHHAKVARRHLDEIALTRLLSAQASQLAGDQTAAEASFAAMLEAPETEFLGLKGLYLQARARGDRAAARARAERAFALRPNAAWAFEAVIDLGLERGAWGEMRAAVDQARRNNLIDGEKAARAKAALLGADAYGAVLAGDDKTALDDAEAALKLARGFVPAAVLAAKLHHEAGRVGKAAKILEAAFAIDAHPAVIRLYDRLYKDEAAEKRAAYLRKLAEQNPDAREAALLRTRAYILTGEWANAVAALEPLLTGSPMAADYALMARAAAGLRGEEAARIWLERAADAPRDPRPGADGDFHITREGWARLVREYMEHVRLAPPPLEDAAEGVSSDELRLLTAPPEPPEDLFDEDEMNEVPDESASAQADGAASSEELPQDRKSAPQSAGRNDEASDEDLERAASAARGVS